ncbi:anti-sigma factor family protein [Bradyrhizobium oligotrophicum S58]
MTEEELHAFVDQTLDVRRKDEVAAYLDAHPDVARRVAAYRRQRELLKVGYGPIADEPIPPQLNLTRIIARQRRPGATSWWMAAAAAAVLLSLGGAGGWSLHGVIQSPEGIAALAEEASASYAVYAPDHLRPVEIKASDRDALLDWTTQRLGRAVAIPDLSASGFRLMGGRVVATSHGPAAMFMYDDDHGTRLVMLARRMAVDQNMPMARQTNGTLNGYSWADKGLGFSLVGPASPERLHPLADDVRKQTSRGI